MLGVRNPLRARQRRSPRRIGRNGHRRTCVRETQRHRIIRGGRRARQRSGIRVCGDKCAAGDDHGGCDCDSFQHSTSSLAIENRKSHFRRSPRVTFCGGLLRLLSPSYAGRRCKTLANRDHDANRLDSFRASFGWELVFPFDGKPCPEGTGSTCFIVRRAHSARQFPSRARFAAHSLSLFLCGKALGVIHEATTRV